MTSSIMSFLNVKKKVAVEMPIIRHKVNAQSTGCEKAPEQYFQVEKK